VPCETRKQSDHHRRLRRIVNSHHGCSIVEPLRRSGKQMTIHPVTSAECSGTHLPRPILFQCQSLTRSTYAEMDTPAMLGDAALAVASQHNSPRVGLLLRRPNRDGRGLNDDDSTTVDSRF